MDLRFTPEENAFRQEVRAFFQENLPKDCARSWSRQAFLQAGAGRLDPQPERARAGRVPHWPVEYGGTGWDPMQQYIFLEEMQQAARRRAPLAFGVNMVGPVIYTFGNEEQKERFLPRIANLDDWWCQGFSEPGAGSDLASLKTTRRCATATTTSSTARRPGPRSRQYADWIFCLVRTDPAAKKQEGISFLLIDMKTPGITVRPIQTIDGGHEVNEVFFDDVRVPVENLVGEENKGWDYAKFLLGNERINIARVGISKERLRRIRELASHRARRRRAADRGPALPREARRRRDRAEGARDDAAARRRGRAHARARASPTRPPRS